MTKKTPQFIQYFVIILSLLMTTGAITGVATSNHTSNYPIPTPTIEEVESTDLPSSKKTEVADYAEQATQVIKIVDDAFNVIGGVLEKWPELSSDDVYTLATATVIVEETYNSFQTLRPPEVMVSNYQKLLHALQLCNDAMPILREGLDNSDKKLINKGKKTLLEANKLLQEGTEEMQTIAGRLLVN